MKRAPASQIGGGEETMHALVLEEREGAFALVDEVRVSGRRGAFQLVTHQAQGTLYFGVAGDGDVEEDGEPSGRPDDLDLPTGRPLLVPIPSTRTSSPAPVTWVRRVELAR